MIIPLSTSQEPAAKSVFDRTFVIDRASAPVTLWPHPDFEQLAVFYPTSFYWLEADDHEALMSVANHHDDQASIYMRLLERDESVPEYWEFQIHDLEYWTEVSGLLENCIYSQHGSWGVCFYEAGFAVLGASSSFIGDLEASLSRPFATQERDMITDARELAERIGEQPRWLTPLLVRLRGDDTDKIPGSGG